jgi:hypothetical protein
MTYYLPQNKVFIHSAKIIREESSQPNHDVVYRIQQKIYRIIEKRNPFAKAQQVRVSPLCFLPSLER